MATRILSEREGRSERTKAAEVDRLKRAVDTVARAAATQPEFQAAAGEAQSAWDESHRLRWRLAMSARRVVGPEARKIAGPLMTLDDLIAEGWIGLHRAAKRFDPDRGIRFATYARWWARAQMTRAVDQGGRLIRLPGGAVEMQRTLRRLQQQLDDAGVEYGLADLAAETGLSEERVQELLAPRTIASLESPIEEGRDRVLGDMLADEEAESTDDIAIRQVLMQRVRHLVDDLEDERHRRVLVLRYGLADGSFRTLSEVGRELGVSRERARQIERRALDRVRQLAGLTNAKAA